MFTQSHSELLNCAGRLGYLVIFSRGDETIGSIESGDRAPKPTKRTAEDMCNGERIYKNIRHCMASSVIAKM